MDKETLKNKLLDKYRQVSLDPKGVERQKALRRIVNRFVHGQERMELDPGQKGSEAKELLHKAFGSKERDPTTGEKNFAEVDPKTTPFSRSRSRNILAAIQRSNPEELAPYFKRSALQPPEKLTNTSGKFSGFRLTPNVTMKLKEVYPHRSTWGIKGPKSQDIGTVEVGSPYKGAKIDYAHIWDPEYKGKGIAQKAYKALSNYYRGLKSDSTTTSRDAYRMWKALAKRGEAIKTDAVNQEGNPIFKIPYRNISKHLEKLKKLTRT